ncbi:hypothetical protein FSP39_007835 [Pinctada imbricata]|uniref:Uncharacterized protein n=1 Tax=Pinctada imbricata TaxID=66713 RepID=A0AA89BYQ1_PINIB|nr:hypothetical protein FSP39_007835 [Pinctada imbricata]
MNKSNIAIAEDKMEVKNAIVSKACENSDRMSSPQSFNSAVSHPKKRWMNDFLCKEDVYHQEENDNIVFEDPLSTDKEQSSSDISSSDTEIIQENPYQNTGDSDATEKYGHEFEEYGSSDDLTRITDSMQQKLNEMFIAQTGESQKHTMTDTQNTVKHSTINENIQETIQSANEKQKIKRFEVSKRKVKKGKRTKSLEVNIKVRSNDNVHTFESTKCVSEQKKIGDSFYAESVGTSSSSERKLNSKSVEKIQSSEKICLDKQSKVGGNREDRNEVSQRRKSKTSKSSFVRRSTRYSRSPGSYAENSSSSEQENEESITEATVVKEEKNDKPKKSKQHKVSKSKKGGMKQARIKKEEIPESKEELMRIKSTQTHQFIKEQEIIFNIIKRGSSENKKTSDFKTRGHIKNLSIPELSREDNINETEAMQTDTKVMPKLEPEISTFQVGNNFNSHNQSLNAAYGEKDAHDAKNKQDTDVSHSTKMKSSCFLPELKKSFLVNTNGGSVPPTIDFQIQREFNKREKVLDLHEIRYENVREDDGKANGGLIHHKMFVIPFVLMNGYKCVTVTDATQMFINCKPKCQKPKTVMQKHRGLFKTFCTWEQVYTLDVLYVRKGRRIKTGDMLLRWDILLASFWDVLGAVKAGHLPPNKNKHKCRYDTL